MIKFIIKVNGKMVNEMEMVFRSGLMDQYIRDNGLRIKFEELANLHITKAIHMMGNGLKIKLMVGVIE